MNLLQIFLKEYELVRRNSLFLKVLIDQEITDPSHPSLLELSPRGIQHVKKTYNISVDKYGSQVKKIHQFKEESNISSSKVRKIEHYSEEGVMINKKMRNLLEFYLKNRDTKKVDFYNLDSYNFQQSFIHPEHQIEFEQLLELSKKNDVFVRISDIFGQVYQKILSHGSNDNSMKSHPYLPFMSDVK